MDRLLTVDEAAAALRLKKSTLYKYSSSRRIPVVRLGGKLLFSERRLQEWIDARSREAIHRGPRGAGQR